MSSHLSVGFTQLLQLETERDTDNGRTQEQLRGELSLATGLWMTNHYSIRQSKHVCAPFQDDKRSEWIYRGSTRLEPMFNLKMTTANAQEKKLAGQQRTRPNMGNLHTRFTHTFSYEQVSAFSFVCILIFRGPEE